MAKINPNEVLERGGGKKDEGVPPGTFLLVIAWMQRRESKAGKPYDRAKFLVIDGACKGRSFFDQIGLDTSNEGTLFRLSLLWKETNGDTSFDPDDEAEFHAALKFKPFKAQVSRRVENGYINNGIQRYVVGDQVTEADRDAMEQWKIDHEAEQEFNGGGGSFPDDDVPPPSDNDVPF